MKQYNVASYRVQAFYLDECFVDEEYVDYNVMLLNVKRYLKIYRHSKYNNTFRLYVEFKSHGLIVKQYYASIDTPFHCERTSKVNYDVHDHSGKLITTVNSHVCALQLANFYDGYVKTYIQCLISKKRFYYE